MACEIERTEGGVVLLDYNDLNSGKDLSASISEGYGLDGIGLLCVKNIPNLKEYRETLLPLASKFALLPESIRAKSEVPESKYSFGWGMGKEILSEGRFDTFKGSYYNNPTYDEPTNDEALKARYPEMCGSNVWPREDLPELEFAFKNLGRLMIDVGIMVAKECDKFVKNRIPQYNLTIEETIRNSRSCKARLLHYYAINEDRTPRSRDSWCSWHNDIGTLTALCSAMYMKEGSITEQINNPDPEAGLYARTRNGIEKKIVIPKDCLAFQIGHAAQVTTGGMLRATPHAVQAPKWPESVNVIRNTFAVFMQPDFNSPLCVPQTIDPNTIDVELFENNIEFGKFANARLETNYA
eukprot:TRINITY_DN127_c0_g4_i1.p1 TRINITY_DN127_c0_g4~~TRINITY_DN127_c0_g4_i1.p1  ORF type:complete len:353 (+),score=174.61 TRINITY_DN127_c0_g4_i1:83-1141(+)